MKFDSEPSLLHSLHSGTPSAPATPKTAIQKLAPRIALSAVKNDRSVSHELFEFALNSQ